MRRMTFAVYNLAPAGDPNRGPEFVERELNAIARPFLRRRKKVIATVEALRRPMPEIPGYNRVRDVSNMMRANLCLYTLARLELGQPEWIELEQSWPRPKAPDKIHEPRAILIQDVEDWRIVHSHAPQGIRRVFRPDVQEGLAAARAEWFEAIVDVLRASRKPTLLLSDPNGLGNILKRRLPDLNDAGTTVEAAHARRALIVNHSLPTRIAGVPLLSDHGRALLGSARKR